ncbi:MAG: 2-oxo acid dehydrogenase subunit E2, partial [Solirubrobacteraceae bacterium]
MLDAAVLPEPTTEIAPAAALKGDTVIEEPNRLQRAIGRRTAETRATIPDLELSIDVDAVALAPAVARGALHVTATLVAACAAALRVHPRVNGAYRDGRYERYSRVNVAVMFATPDAQVPATVLDADTRSPVELADELGRLQERARNGALTPPEQAGATFTLLDLGAS